GDLAFCTDLSAGDHIELFQHKFTCPFDETGISAAFDLSLDKVALKLDPGLGPEADTEGAPFVGSDGVNDRARAERYAVAFHHVTPSVLYDSIHHIKHLSSSIFTGAYKKAGVSMP